MNEANNSMTQPETDIKIIFNDEEEDEVFHGFTIKYITDATPNVNKLLME